MHRDETSSANPTGRSVTLVYESDGGARQLREALGAGGLTVVSECRLSELSVGDRSVLHQSAPIWIVNLDSDSDAQLDLLESLLSEADRRVIFNDAGATRALQGPELSRWSRQLVAKVLGVDGNYPAAPASQTDAQSDAMDYAADGVQESLVKVWVLGASIGGPESVRAFLEGLPKDMPIAFVLAQHMGEEFLDLMTEQLDRAGEVKVKRAAHGDFLRHGEVVVVPTDQRILVGSDGLITLQPLELDSPYSPCIDQVLRDVADQFGRDAGAIVFSGMASDAVQGSRYLADCGGTVWAQDASTCVVSSMVEGATDCGAVSFTATPAHLAEALTGKYFEESRYG